MVHAELRRDSDYLDRAERHARRTLARRADVAAMANAASEPDGARDFERLLFLARFWEGATGILRRSGPGSADTARLTAELASKVEEAAAIIDRLLPRDDAAGDPPAAGRMPGDLASMASLAELLRDLALLKAYDLAGEHP